jgi:U6 snRNA-associated Sm-like protein LSm4
MNITLREVYQTSAEGDRFWKLRECYIRGSTVRALFTFRLLVCPFLLVCSFRTKIKYLRVPDTLLDAVKEEQARARETGRGARGALVGGAGGVVGNRGVCSCISSA